MDRLMMLVAAIAAEVETRTEGMTAGQVVILGAMSAAALLLAVI